MKLLAFDTSSKALSVAILEDEYSTCRNNINH